MNYPLFINATVSLIMGGALILLWHRDRTQRFTLYLGWANLIQLLIPVAYGVSRASTGALHWAGVWLLPLAAGIATRLLWLRSGGSERLASAMTTALSPLRTMLIMMIWSSAIQNSELANDIGAPR